MILMLNFWRGWKANLFLFFLIICVKSPWFGMPESRAICHHGANHLKMWVKHSRLKNPFKKWKCKSYTLPETNISAENQWLEDDSFPFWVKRPIFRGNVNVSFRECIFQPPKTNGGCSPEAMISFPKAGISFFFLGLLSGEPAVRFRGQI